MQIGSGFDVSTIVAQLVTLERQPTQERIQATLNSISMRLSSMGQLKSALSDFNESLKSLSQNHDLKGVDVKSSNEDLMHSITDDYNGATGQYRLEVINRAERDSFTTQASRWSDESVGAGSFTITNNQGDTKTINISEGVSTLSDIADTINQEAREIGVQASILNIRNESGRYEQHLLVQSRETGADNGFNITSGDAAYQFLSTPEMNQVSSAQNASIQMGGLTFTSTVNTFNDAIQGIDIDIAKLKKNDVVDFQIEKSTDSVKESTQTFIDGFNKILSMIDSENRKIDSSLAIQIRNELRKSINHQTLLSNGTLSSLSSAGITTDPKTGQLSLDERKFEAFLEDSSQGMDELLSGDNGILNGLINGIDRMLDSDGVIASRTQSLNSQEGRVNDQQEALDRRMEIYERRVSAQYMQLEKIINSLSDDNNVILNLYK